MHPGTPILRTTDLDERYQLSENAMLLCDVVYPIHTKITLFVCFCVWNNFILVTNQYIAMADISADIWKFVIIGMGAHTC